MKRKDLTVGRYFMAAVTHDVYTSHSYEGYDLYRITGIDGDLITCFNVTTQTQEEPERDTFILNDDSVIVLSDTEADALWKALVTFAAEQSLDRVGSLVDTYGREPVDVHSRAY